MSDQEILEEAFKKFFKWIKTKDIKEVTQLVTVSMRSAPSPSTALIYLKAFYIASQLEHYHSNLDNAFEDAREHFSHLM